MGCDREGKINVFNQKDGKNVDSLDHENIVFCIRIIPTFEKDKFYLVSSG